VANADDSISSRCAVQIHTPVSRLCARNCLGCRRSSVMLFYDPAVPLDAMHASLFTRPMSPNCRMRRYGIALQSSASIWDQFEAVLTLAAEGRI